MQCGGADREAGGCSPSHRGPMQAPRAASAASASAAPTWCPTTGVTSSMWPAGCVVPAPCRSGRTGGAHALRACKLTSAILASTRHCRIECRHKSLHTCMDSLPTEVVLQGRGPVTKRKAAATPRQNPGEKAARLVINQDKAQARDNATPLAHGPAARPLAAMH